MVGLEVLVTDQQGNRLTGIPVYVHVIPSGNPIYGTTQPYNLTPQNTNSMGIANWSNVEAGAQFQAVADGSPNYTTETGSTSTTLTSGGYIQIVLAAITAPTASGTCKTGYTYDQNIGYCVQVATVGTSGSIAAISDWIGKYWYIFAIILVIIVIGIVIAMIYKSKGKSTTNIEAKLI